jgi:hypothetical protein
MARAGKGLGALPVTGGILVLLAALVLGALMFGPKREAAPPPSMSRPESRPVRDSQLPLDRPEVAAPWQYGPADMVTPEAVPAQEETEAPELRITITGRVTDAITGEGIAGVIVNAGRSASQEEQADWRRRTAEAAGARDRRALMRLRQEQRRLVDGRRETSGNDGSYSITLDAAGVYNVEFIHAEYITAERQTPPLNEETASASIDATLSKGATIMGRVTEKGGSKGAPGVMVVVEGESRPPVETAADGSYQIQGLRPGEVGVTLNLRDTPYRTSEVLPYQRVRLSGPDDVVRGVDFTVEAAGVVWGYIKTPKGEAVPGTNVMLVSSSSIASQALTAVLEESRPIGGNANEEGYYELLGVPLDKEWRLYATNDDYAPQLADPFMLSRSVREVRVDVFLFDGTTVRGRTVTGGGDVVPEAAVLCIPGYSAIFAAFDTPRAFRDTTSDANGEFSIDELPAGDYQLLARKDGFKFSMRGVSIFSDGYSDINNIRVFLEPVEEAEHEVFGVVVDKDDQGLDGVELTLSGFRTESFSGGEDSTTTGADGTFRFSQVESGMYSLMAEKEGHGTQTLRNVPLDKELRIRMNTLATVRGRVLIRESNEPPPTYSVAARATAADGATNMDLLRTFEEPESYDFNDPEGRFEIQLADGPWQLEAKAPEHAPGREEIYLEPGQLMEDVVLYVNADGGRIAGRVVTNDGQNPQGATVFLVETAGGDYQTTSAMLRALSGDAESMRVGEDGAFEFTQLTEGTYLVLAEHERYATGRSEAIFLTEGDARDDIQVRLSFGGAIEGNVLINGRPAYGATVTAFGEGTPQVTQTENEGYFRFEGLAPGSYLVSAVPFGTGGLSALLDIRMERVYVEEGQTATAFFDDSGTEIIGLCSPHPATGDLTAGLATLSFPGTGPTMIGVSLNALSLLENPYLLSGGTVSTTGEYRIRAVPPGEYQINIYYGSLLGSLRLVAVVPVMVQGEPVLQLDIQVDAP